VCSVKTAHSHGGYAECSPPEARGAGRRCCLGSEQAVLAPVRELLKTQSSARPAFPKNLHWVISHPYAGQPYNNHPFSKVGGAKGTLQVTQVSHKLGAVGGHRQRDMGSHCEISPLPQALFLPSLLCVLFLKMM
jgi:hypothetical protein